MAWNTYDDTHTTHSTSHGFVWLLQHAYNTSPTDDTARAKLFELMTMIDEGIAGHVIIYGKYLDTMTGQFLWQPPDIHESPPAVWTLARTIASTTLRLPTYDGIQFGTMLKRTQPLQHATGGLLITWSRDHRADYVITQCRLAGWRPEGEGWRIREEFCVGLGDFPWNSQFIKDS